jgi:hypothetical protein
VWLAGPLTVSCLSLILSTSWRLPQWSRQSLVYCETRKGPPQLPRHAGMQFALEKPWRRGEGEGRGPKGGGKT